MRFRDRKDGVTEAFWELVALGRSDREAFQARLDSLNRRSLEDFCWAFLRAQTAISAPPFIDVIAAGLSEDELDTLTEWVVSQGRSFYEGILSDPDRMPAEADANEPCMGLLGDAMLSYKRRFDSWVPPSPDAMP